MTTELNTLRGLPLCRVGVSLYNSQDQLVENMAFDCFITANDELTPEDVAELIDIGKLPLALGSYVTLYDTDPELTEEELKNTNHLKDMWEKLNEKQKEAFKRLVLNDYPHSEE